jgi:hypothetical protein
MWGGCITLMQLYESSSRTLTTHVSSSHHHKHKPDKNHGNFLSLSILVVIFTKVEQPSNLPNLRRLFVEARTEAEESAYSRNAVSHHIYYHQLSGYHLSLLECK